MAIPLLVKAGGALLLALMVGGGKKEPVAAPTSMSVPERMARVLQTNDPNAIRFEAGRLRQEGHAVEAGQLEQAAATLEAEIKAGTRPAPVYPASAPPAAGGAAGPLTQPPVGPLPAGAVTSPGFVPPVVPAGVVLPLPTLGPNEVLHYVKPPAPYDPRVQAWQTKLLSLGISVGPAGADGKFGDGTRAGTTAFQKRANEEAKRTGQPQISVNGMLDGPTLARAALVFPMPAAASAGAPKPPIPVVVAPPPIVVPMPAAVPPPIVVQTPAGPIAVPAVPMPPVVMPAAVPMPPVVMPPVMMPPVVPMPPVVMPPVLPVGLPPVVPLPLPKLAKGQAVLPSQTASANAKLIQAKLISLGFLKAADVPASQVGIYGPKTTAAVTAFQKAANAYLAQSGQSFILPNAGVTVSKAKPLGVDGKWGAQTNDVAALAHPPNTVGALWGAFGAPPMPMPASPLPGVIPPMMPAALDSRVGLAARLLGNLSEARHGQEDRTLVSMFQAQQGLRASGYYQPETALELARLGFVPPPPRYWPSSGRGKSKKNYRNAILRFAASDPQRKEEWELAARLAA